MVNKRFILAVDGGGTSTDVAIAQLDHENSPQRILRASGQGTNLTTLGIQSVGKELLHVIRAAWGSESLPKFELAFVALAGAGTRPAQIELANWLTQQNLAATVRVLSDADFTLSIAQLSAPEDHAALALIAGTGSIAMGCLPDSDTPIRAGGWGALLGDDGSGFWLGRAAVRHTLDLLDRGSPLTTLGAAIAEECNAKSAREIVRSLHLTGDGVRRLAMLAPLVITSADAGDRKAIQIVEEAGNQLCELLSILTRRLEHPPQQTTIACNGSLIIKAASLRQHLESFTQQAGYAAIYFIEDPVIAALHLAAAATSDPP